MEEQMKTTKSEDREEEENGPFNRLLAPPKCSATRTRSCVIFFVKFSVHFCFGHNDAHWNINKTAATAAATEIKLQHQQQ